MECCLDCGKVYKHKMIKRWLNLTVGHFFSVIPLGVPKLPFKGYAEYTKCPRCKTTKVLKWTEDDLSIKGSSIREVRDGRIFMSN